MVELTPQQKAEEPDEYTESSSLQASAPVVCFHYQQSKLQEEKRQDEVARTLTPLRPPAASARRCLGSFCQSFIGKGPCCCTRERMWSSGAK